MLLIEEKKFQVSHRSKCQIQSLDGRATYQQHQVNRTRKKSIKKPFNNWCCASVLVWCTSVLLLCANVLVLCAGVLV